MSYIPHTDDDIKQMLASIGANRIDDLYDEIPSHLRIETLSNIDHGLNEMQASRLAKTLSERDRYRLNFIGAGAYEHHIPAAVWQIASRGEFLTCYTPYQAEASQGSLQLMYEFQSMMAHLTGMQVANASMYDGASALAEAILMAIRCQRQSTSKTVLLPKSLHPYYRQVVKSIVCQQQIDLIDIDINNSTGQIDQQQLDSFAADDITAMVIPQPNFFGVLEDVDSLTDWCVQRNILSIAVVNPLSLGLLKEPGQWASDGVDIVCGELQPLGIPLSSGGPYAGFLCCRQSLVRQMPGRIVGRTKDTQGQPGFVLTLQAREQHIRRSKATSNICTNQGLLVTAATIHMSLLGFHGLQAVAQQCHSNCRYLVEQLQTIDGITRRFQTPYFHEVVMQFAQPLQPIITTLSQQGILAGFALHDDYPELGNALLLCVTETKTVEDIDDFVSALKNAITEYATC